MSESPPRLLLEELVTLDALVEHLSAGPNEESNALLEKVGPLIGDRFVTPLLKPNRPDERVYGGAAVLQAIEFILRQKSKGDQR